MSATKFASLIAKDFTADSVHVTTAIGNGRRKKKTRKFSDFVDALSKSVDVAEESASWSFPVEIAKSDDELRVVYGWASMSKEGDDHVVDLQGDKIAVPDLVKAAHEYVTNFRDGGDLHTTLGIGKVVESIVLTPEVQKALGIDLGKVGWFIGMKVDDDGVWKRVKSGELKAFSIGGSGSRVPDTGE